MDPRTDRGRRVPAAGIAMALAVLGAIGVLGLVAGFVWQQDPTVAGQSIGDTARVDTSTLPAAVPLRRVGGHLVVDVFLGPDGPLVPMLLDTGAPTMLSAELAARSGAELIGSARLASLVGGSTDVEVVRVADLSIGRAHFTDGPALVGALTPYGPMADIAAHGIVGANLMQGAVWQIDYAAATLTIAADTSGLDHLDAVALEFVPASRDSPSPLVWLAIDGVPRQALLDTGSDRGLVVHPNLVKATRLRGSLRPSAVESWDGRHEVSTRYAIAEVSLGHTAPQRHGVLTTAVLPPDNVVIGNDFLASYVVTIDWRDRKIYLDPGVGYTRR